jgi:hypothetical protein
VSFDTAGTVAVDIVIGCHRHQPGHTIPVAYGPEFRPIAVLHRDAGCSVLIDGRSSRAI